MWDCCKFGPLGGNNKKICIFAAPKRDDRVSGSLVCAVGHSGCSAVRLARQLRELEAESSNLFIPTENEKQALALRVQEKERCRLGSLLTTAYISLFLSPQSGLFFIHFCGPKRSRSEAT